LINFSVSSFTILLPVIQQSCRCDHAAEGLPRKRPQTVVDGQNLIPCPPLPEPGHGGRIPYFSSSTSSHPIGVGSSSLHAARLRLRRSLPWTGRPTFGIPAVRILTIPTVHGPPFRQQVTFCSFPSLARIVMDGGVFFSRRWSAAASSD